MNVSATRSTPATIHTAPPAPPRPKDADGDNDGTRATVKTPSSTGNPVVNGSVDTYA